MWQTSQPDCAHELVEDLHRGRNMAGAVYIECTAMYSKDSDLHFESVVEVEFVNGVAAKHLDGFSGNVRACAGIVDRVDRTMGTMAADVLQARTPQNPKRLKRIRHIARRVESPAVLPLHWPAPKGLPLDKKFGESLTQLAASGLSFEAQFYYPQLSELLDFLDVFPETTAVINHLATVVRIGFHAEFRAREIERWKLGLVEVAARPEGLIKIDGLSMRIFIFNFTDRDQATQDEEFASAWKSVIETCIETFGPSRVLFEGSRSVGKAGILFRVMGNASRRAVAVYSKDEKNDVPAGTAIWANRNSVPLGQKRSTHGDIESALRSD
jgi:predicted TIM-barrel fold metal-dependent hydrolase